MKLYIRNVWVIKNLSICIDLIIVVWDALVGQKFKRFLIFFINWALALYTYDKAFTQD